MVLKTNLLIGLLLLTIPQYLRAADAPEKSTAEKPIPVKPPFTSTPLGQPLSADAPVTDKANATSTPNSPLGGYPGNTRSGGTKLHGGLDDPSKNPATDIVRWTGTGEGKVIKAGPAYTKDHKYLGEGVVIEMKTETGTWTSSAIHLRGVSVDKDYIVKPGQQIGFGAGAGDQFKSAEAGDPHVHWEVRHNGQLVNPTSGEQVIPTQPVEATVEAKPAAKPAPPPPRPAASPPPAKTIVGTWQWLPKNQIVTVNANGTCTSSFNNSGTWSSVGNRTYQLKWKNGYIDTMTLSGDGNSLTGHNQYSPNSNATHTRIR